MGWDRALAATAAYAKPEEFETFRRHLDAGWIEQALAATGTATLRRRRPRRGRTRALGRTDGRG